MYYGLREKFLRWLSVSIFSETNPGVWPLVAVQEFLCTPVKQWNSIMLHICIFLFNVQSLIHYQFWMWYITSGRKPGFQLPLVIYQHPCREVSAVQLQIPHAFLSLPVSMVRSVHIQIFSIFQVLKVIFHNSYQPSGRLWNEEKTQKQNCAWDDSCKQF